MGRESKIMLASKVSLSYQHQIYNRTSKSPLSPKFAIYAILWKVKCFLRIECLLIMAAKSISTVYSGVKNWLEYGWVNQLVGSLICPPIGNVKMLF